MIESMTGFGRGQSQVGGTTATIEMRSVNSRYCEVSLRLPRALAEYESELQVVIKQAFSRGRINVQVQIETAADDVLAIRVNPDAARAYASLLESLRATAGISEPVRLEHLLNYSEIFTTADAPEEATDEMRQAVRSALDDAIADMRAMRRREGRALQEDLESRVGRIEQILRRVEQRAPDRVIEGREKLYTRLGELLDDERLDRDRLELEIALIADRLDVSEECVRLRSHLEMFRESLQNDDPEGRKLNFISQEINREVNTIGSKANDAEIARLAVEMKDELEKIREQVQNVE